jgi:hypothetical protein
LRTVCDLPAADMEVVGVAVNTLLPPPRERKADPPTCSVCTRYAGIELTNWALDRWLRRSSKPDDAQPGGPRQIDRRGED